MAVLGFSLKSCLQTDGAQITLIFAWDKCEVTVQLFNSLLIAGIVSALIAQPVREEVVQATKIYFNTTDNSLQVMFNITSGQPLQVLTANYGVTFVANIINTQLALPESNSFRSNNPIEGIAAVEVTQ